MKRHQEVHYIGGGDYFPTILFDTVAQFLDIPVEHVSDLMNRLNDKGYLGGWDIQIGRDNRYDFGIPYHDPALEAGLKEYEQQETRMSFPPTLTEHGLGLIKDFASIFRGKRPNTPVRESHWSRLRRQIMKAQQVCSVCRWDRNLDLHHHHYDSFNSESVEDVELLCERCHKLLHSIARDSVQSLCFPLDAPQN
jgi:hypothetical protein